MSENLLPESLRSILLVCLLLLCAPHAGAAVVEGIYQARVVILDQSRNSQDAAAREAMTQVLVKASGSRALLDNEQISNNIRRARNFLRAFQFESSAGELVYVAQFDQAQIEKMIRAAGFPLWGSRRPDALLWFAVQDEFGFERNLLDQTSESILTQQAVDTANQRGIRVSFPLMDLTDLEQLNLYDVWASNIQAIQGASARYPAEFVLSARIYQNQPSATEGTSVVLAVPAPEPVWTADWVLLHKEERVFGTLSAKTQQSISDDLVQRLADEMATRYAIDVQQTGEAQAVEIQISNIRQLTDYVTVSRYLDSLSVVAHVELRSQIGDTATFELQLFGNPQDLTNTLSLDNKFQVAKDAFGRDLTDMNYRWTP